MAMTLRRNVRRFPVIKTAHYRMRKAVNGADFYEKPFSNAMSSEFRAGDVIWDVGANIGVYTKVFAEATGVTGRVYAFEPAPACRPELDAITSDFPTVTVLPYALYDRNTQERYDSHAHSNDVTNRIDSDGDVIVECRTADWLVAEGSARLPNIIKIDVEGFEPEVIAGMRRTLSDPNVRAIFVEVHFQRLDERGLTNFPRDLETALKAAGYKVSWLDSSHLRGIR